MSFQHLEHISFLHKVASPYGGLLARCLALSRNARRNCASSGTQEMGPASEASKATGKASPAGMKQKPGAVFVCGQAPEVISFPGVVHAARKGHGLPNVIRNASKPWHRNERRLLSDRDYVG